MELEQLLELEFRMYGLVPYNLSPIQQGIQFGHGVVEYMLKYPIDNMVTNETCKWASEDKTFIILNGGTTNNGLLNPKELGDDKKLIFKGSLNNHALTLNNKGVKIAKFNEPDLGDQLTAVAFLVDERVWNREKYSDRIWYEDKVNEVVVSDEPDKHYTERLGGEKNVFLREFLSQFKLA